MPEAHSLHRYAREQREALAGQVLRVTSPQGRFDPRPVDGARLADVQAHGKHLLHLFAGTDLVVHVHLGLKGFFLRTDDLTLPPLPSTRLRLQGEREAFSLVAPARCETLDPTAREELLAGLGPDPLRDGRPARAEAARRLAGRRAVGVAVLDQAVWAGIGNAWRAELLFLLGVDPARPVDVEEAGRLWDLACDLLPLGVDAGQVVSDPATPDERWVYKRATCRRCGAPVQERAVGGRSAWVCPAEQT